MKPFDYYKAPRQPSKNEFHTYYVYSRGDTIFKGNFAEYKKFVATLTATPKVFEEVLNERAYEDAFIQSRVRTIELREEFYVDACEEAGVDRNWTRCRKAMQMAYELEDGNGLDAIFERFLDLAKLIKD